MDGLKSIKNVVFDITGMSLSNEVRFWHSNEFAGNGNTVLIFVVRGKGELDNSVESVILEKGDLFVLPAGLEAGLKTLSSEPLSMYCIAFSCAKALRHNNEWSIEKYTLPVQGIIRVGNTSVIYHQIDKLYRTWGDYSLTETSKIQICFMEVWEAIMSGMLEKNYKEGFRYVIKGIIDHIEEHYTETFQAEELVQFAGMSTATFYQQFKHYTSFTPLQYVTQKRMEHAKRLLVSTEMKITEVAKTVGYQDEYYFSRKFKQVVGVSPSSYMQSLRRRITVLTSAFVGDLMALGVSWDMLSPSMANKHQKHGLLQTRESELDLHRLRIHTPDLIIGSDEALKLYPYLAEIAPTRLISYKSGSWREHLYQLAEIIGIGEVAKSWLRFYDQRAENARKLIASHIGNETVLAVRVNTGGFRVFGEKRRKLGDVLYRDLQLNVPDSVRDFTFRDMDSLHEVNDFDADHILLFTDQEVRANWEEWSSTLKGNVHLIQTYPWLNYSAMVHERLLTKAVSLFAG
ncbi:helix-turn-helix domain-containing protein [Aneurinibacillus migulanus]|uniref:helix-turn-helix domain-containing protein n=1 Tax=Aneurinibacillus migulanus TaxID=47500 RepID=UPI00209F0C54|nr:helix-turn-helix domain-containing protein [Aneurinibacillus migulanus]MCP1358319.1 helix-turn-helix domain-containing protein [Aneurinibacillus migulanus]